MNGELNELYNKIKTELEVVKAIYRERSEVMTRQVDDLMKKFEEERNKIESLPCAVRGEKIKQTEKVLNDIKDNHLKHINLKINTLLFSVLGSIFLVVLVAGVKFLFST